MTDDRKAGIALITGSAGGILTMAIHPTNSATLSMAAPAHTLALVSTVLLFLGACGLARRASDLSRLAFAALVTFGFACSAVMIAAAISGFAIPDMMNHMGRDTPDAAHQWRIVIDGIFQLNQACSRIYAVGASIAIILWCLSGIRTRQLGRGTVIYGWIIAPLIILAVGSGHLRLNVHGAAVVMLGQTIWFIAAGAQMCSEGQNQSRRLPVTPVS